MAEGRCEVSAKDRLDEIDKPWKPHHKARLLAALRAVLELHRQTLQGGCTECSGEEFVRWPCQTYQAIEEALR